MRTCPSCKSATLDAWGLSSFNPKPCPRCGAKVTLASGSIALLVLLSSPAWFLPEIHVLGPVPSYLLSVLWTLIVFAAGWRWLPLHVLNASPAVPGPPPASPAVKQGIALLAALVAAAAALIWFAAANGSQL